MSIACISFWNRGSVRRELSQCKWHKHTSKHIFKGCDYGFGFDCFHQNYTTFLILLLTAQWEISVNINYINQCWIWVLMSWGDNCWMKTLFYLWLHNLSTKWNYFTEIAFFLQPESFDVFCFVYVCPAEPVPDVIGLLLCLLWLFLLSKSLVY